MMPNIEPVAATPSPGGEVPVGHVGVVEAVWRYPVKSMAGEPLETVSVGPRGLAGDRRWAVYSGDGRLGSGKEGRRLRRMDPLFTLAAQTSAASGLGALVTVEMPDGEYLVVGEPSTDQALSRLLGEPVSLRAEGACPGSPLGPSAPPVPHHDAGAVSLVGTATLVALGVLLHGPPVDPRALRANLVVETRSPYAEETWTGRELAIGGVRLRVIRRTERCRMVDLDQVRLPGRRGLLKAVGNHRDLCVGMYADVLAPGELAVGDPVTLRG